MNKRIIIFDFDGVFTSNFLFHKKHIELFLRKKISEKDFYDLHYGNVYKDDGKGMELGQFDVASYCRFIKSDFEKLPLAFGMKEVVDHAKERAQIFIVSSSCADNITRFLAKNHFNVADFVIYGVETHPSKKVKFEKIITETGVTPDNMIFVTDTLGDITEATEMGIASIAVLWGFHNRETLAQGEPFAFAHNPHDISTHIDTFFAQ